METNAHKKSKILIKRALVHLMYMNQLHGQLCTHTFEYQIHGDALGWAE